MVDYFHGNIFLNIFFIESKNPQIFKEIKFEFVQYIFEKIIVQITEANIGSEIEASTNSSLDTGNQTKTGNFKFFLAKITNHFILTHPQTQTAHSGNIPSLQTFFNSSLTKCNISSYLAVTIFDK
jgi:hypothetical protein